MIKTKHFYVTEVKRKPVLNGSKVDALSRSQDQPQKQVNPAAAVMKQIQSI